MSDQSQSAEGLEPVKTEETKTSENQEAKVEIQSQPNLLSMSDEEFLKMGVPEAPPKKEKEKEPEKEEEKKPDESADSGADPDKGKGKEPEKAAETKSSKADEGDNQDDKTKDKTPSSGSEPEKKSKTDDQAKGDKKPEVDTKPDYEGFFKQVMTPFKANGKVVEVKTPEEAIRLMQMGAGYGRKIQDMQPHLKVLRMLEKNNLLDESKLSFLIDLNQKKPEAIKKLVKDGGIDPLDLSAEDKVAYQPGNHSVSDKEVAFHETLKEVQGQPGGHDTLRIINQTWDQESKGLLWDTPEIFKIIQTQRENGVYDQITAEIDRQKTLGSIEYSTPFLQAYKIAGDHLVKTNGFKQVKSVQTQPETTTTKQAEVIATRTAIPKAEASNSEKAAAAASTKTSTVPKVALTRNPLEMSDDEFMKLANANR